MADLTPGSIPESTTHFAALDSNVITEAPPSEALPPIINDSPSMTNLRGGLWKEDGTQPLSQDAQNVNALHESVHAHIQQNYADPQAAIERWKSMAEEGAISGTAPTITNPTDLGRLKDGVEPASVHLPGMQAGLESYQMAPPEAREEAKNSRNPGGETPGQNNDSAPDQNASQNPSGVAKVQDPTGMNKQLLESFQVHNLSI